MTDSEQELKNREIIETLRNALVVAAERLTPEVEPSLVYAVKPVDEEQAG